MKKDHIENKEWQKVKDMLTGKYRIWIYNILNMKIGEGSYQESIFHRKYKFGIKGVDRGFQYAMQQRKRRKKNKKAKVIFGFLIGLRKIMISDKMNP